MTSETETNLALLLAALRYLQEKGADVPPPGQVTPEALDRLARELEIPVSLSTLKRFDSIALAKFRNAALRLGRSHFLQSDN